MLFLMCAMVNPGLMLPLILSTALLHVPSTLAIQRPFPAADLGFRHLNEEVRPLR